MSAEKSKLFMIPLDYEGDWYEDGKLVKIPLASADLKIAVQSFRWTGHEGFRLVEEFANGEAHSRAFLFAKDESLTHEFDRVNFTSHRGWPNALIGDNRKHYGLVTREGKQLWPAPK